MNTNICVSDKSNNLWNKEDIIYKLKDMYANTLSDLEFTTFIEIGKATGLNPFLREIWAVKYGNQSANIFIGRDGYRKAAQENPDYDYHHVDAVYSNDNFSIKNGEVHHQYSVSDRGNLIGGYCIVKRKSSSKPQFNYVELQEYSSNKSLWVTKPATMIKKVAEAQCLRMTFQSIFSGTYDESENWKTSSNETVNIHANEVINPSRYEMISELKTLIKEKGISDEVIQKGLEKENVKYISDLCMDSLNNWIERAYEWKGIKEE
ncbi:phage recombination protein Bet [Flavobacterium sp.]|uniref:phage recombination protein Bet n=1 Tax=Flavobacterium sp. TaxID=239 RepID=UPI003F69B0CA